MRICVYMYTFSHMRPQVRPRFAKETENEHRTDPQHEHLPRGPKLASRLPQEGPKRVQEAPRGSQEDPDRF